MTCESRIGFALVLAAALLAFGGVVKVFLYAEELQARAGR
jgi:hypothetical protein